jgi:hypothetical protein
MTDYVYRVTGPDVDRIDAPWATVTMAERPSRDDTFTVDGRTHAVRSVRRVEAPATDAGQARQYTLKARDKAGRCYALSQHGQADLAQELAQLARVLDALVVGETLTIERIA